MALEAPTLVAHAFAGVATTFVNAVTAFNSQNFDALDGLFDDHVVLYKVKNGDPIIGKAAVMRYLRTDVMADKPIFAPVTTTFHPPALPSSVRGEALWGDNDNGTHTTLPIDYEFHFQPFAPFHITSLWGSQD